MPLVTEPSPVNALAFSALALCSPGDVSGSGNGEVQPSGGR